MKRLVLILCTILFLSGAGAILVPSAARAQQSAGTEVSIAVGADIPQDEIAEDNDGEAQDSEGAYSLGTGVTPAQAFEPGRKSSSAAPSAYLRDGAYVNAKGETASGFVTVDGRLFYLSKSGKTVQKGWICPGGAWYFIDDDGSVHLQWLCSSRKWYYMDDNTGRMLTGWIRKDAKLYYFDRNGIMKTGWLTVGSKRYYLTAGGPAITGWLLLDDEWYHFNDKYEMQTGWIMVNGKQYYLGEDGKMVTGTMTVDGRECVFGEDGALISPAAETPAQDPSAEDVSGGTDEPGRVSSEIPSGALSGTPSGATGTAQ